MSVNSTTETPYNGLVVVNPARREIASLDAGSYVPERRPLRILQITDCHLGENVGELLVGMDTDASLDYVLKAIQQELSVSQLNPELLLVTGDLANHGSLAAYQRLNEKLDQLDLPFVWLPGNHDVPGLMQQAVEPEVIPAAALSAGWAMVMLDSTVPGEVGGEIGQNELQRLRDTMARLPDDCYVMVCVHHQVLAVGCDWIDEQKISDSDDLVNLLADYPQVRLVVSGHVHQDVRQHDARLPQGTFLTSPSTCIQFAPGVKDFKVDDKQPGYRWFDLHPDGSFDTGVVRVEAADLSIDLDSSGY